MDAAPAAVAPYHAGNKPVYTREEMRARHAEEERRRRKRAADAERDLFARVPAAYVRAWIDRTPRARGYTISRAMRMQIAQSYFASLAPADAPPPYAPRA
jgi:hypothetical protein